MKAARIDAPGKLQVVDLPRPTPGPGDALVSVAYAGICGSDVEVLAGRRPRQYVRYPLVPGHEWAGTVVDVGEGVDASVLERKVVGQGFPACQACEHCRVGDAALCRTSYDEIGFTRPGAWAEQFVLPARLLRPLSVGSDLRSAAGLEPASCAADAVARAGVRPGYRVAVVGGGSLGLLATQLLRDCGLAELVVVEPNAHRRDLAHRCGATATLHPDEAITRRGYYHVVLEAAGVEDSAVTAMSLARRGGRVVLTGIPSSSASMPVRDLVTKRLEVATVFGGSSGAWASAVAAFESGALDPGLLVTHEFPLVEVADAFGLIASGDPTVVKILLRP